MKEADDEPVAEEVVTASYHATEDAASVVGHDEDSDHYKSSLRLSLLILLDNSAIW